MAAKTAIVLSARAKAAAAFLEARPGATPFRVSPNVTMYKTGGKIFAIHSVAGGYVVLKCDPGLIDILKAKYAGVGHKTHLDRRYWIAVETDGDVPPKELRRLAEMSYELARAAPKRAVRKKSSPRPG
jgi:predicted DNA-binding protein (MmcQ/YjbR family)